MHYAAAAGHLHMIEFLISSIADAQVDVIYYLLLLLLCGFNQ